jgi:hypothetical protein
MKRAAFLIGLALLLPGTARAEEPRPAPAPASEAAATPAIRVGPRWVACTAEVQKFCAGTERGQGWVRSCLKPHLSELSDPCKAIIGADGGKDP